MSWELLIYSHSERSTGNNPQSCGWCLKGRAGGGSSVMELSPYLWNLVLHPSRVSITIELNCWIPGWCHRELLGMGKTSTRWWPEVSEVFCVSGNGETHSKSEFSQTGCLEMFRMEVIPPLLCEPTFLKTVSKTQKHLIKIPKENLIRTHKV